MKAKRQSRVEPVARKLLQFVGLRKTNTISYNKQMYLSAIAYTIRKHLKFIRKKIKSDIVELGHLIIFKMDQIASEVCFSDLLSMVISNKNR
jgi:DNA topoisomerase VI subunit B